MAAHTLSSTSPMSVRSSPSPSQRLAAQKEGISCMTPHAPADEHDTVAPPAVSRIASAPIT